MKLAKKGKVLNLILGEECTIIDAEAHMDLIRNLPENIDRIHLKIDSPAELDTAYLQCLYALKKEAEEKHIILKTTGKSKVFEHACMLYGLERIEPFSLENKKNKTKTHNCAEDTVLP